MELIIETVNYCLWVDERGEYILENKREDYRQVLPLNVKLFIKEVIRKKPGCNLA